MQHLWKLCRSTQVYKKCLNADGIQVYRRYLLTDGSQIKVSSFAGRMPQTTSFLMLPSRPAHVAAFLDTCCRCSLPALTVPARYASSEPRTSSTSQDILRELKSKEYTSLYLNSKMRFLRTLCRSASLSAAAGTTVVPIVALLAYFGQIPSDQATSFSFMMVVVAALFNANSYFFISRVVGKVMLSTDETYAKISHLTLWGRKKDLYVKISDILPITGSVYDRNIVALKFNNSSKKLILFPREGTKDTNIEVLEALFQKKKTF